MSARRDMSRAAFGPCLADSSRVVGTTDRLGERALTHMPSGQRLRSRLRKRAERTDRSFGSRPVAPSHPWRTLPNASFDRSASGDGPGDPTTTTDLSAVGQGTPDAGCRGRADGPSPPGDRHVRTGSSLPAGSELVGFGSGKWILRAGSAEGAQNLGRMFGIRPVRVDWEVYEPMFGCRSLREGERPREESTRAVKDLGGRGREHAKVRMQRTQVEPPGQSNGYRS